MEIRDTRRKCQSKYNLTLATVGILAGAGRATALKVAGRVYADGRRMATVHIVIALVNVYALGAVCLVARFAPAIVPAGHVDAQGRRVVTPMQSRRTLVQVLFAGRSDKAHATRTEIRRHALAPIQTSVLAHSCTGEGRGVPIILFDLHSSSSSIEHIMQVIVLTFTGESVAGIPVLAATRVRALGVQADRVLVAGVLASVAFVNFYTIKLIYSTVSGQTFAYI